MCTVAKKYFPDPAPFGGRPPKERKCADDLQPDFPSIAVGKFSDEHALVRSDPAGAFLCKFLKQVDRTH
jgi:hypothetical protein